jgi:hypothetical protein
MEFLLSCPTKGMIAIRHTVKVQHVRQRTSCDCVIATAAIVANLPYAEAARVSPVQPGRRGLFSSETRSILFATTGVRWFGPRLAWFRGLSHFATMPSLRVIDIRRQKTLSELFKLGTISHCIATRNGIIFDPEFDNPISVADYPRLDWTVIGYYTPWNANKLETAQLINAKRFSRSDRLWSDLMMKS